MVFWLLEQFPEQDLSQTLHLCQVEFLAVPLEKHPGSHGLPECLQVPEEGWHLGNRVGIWQLE